ncbi:MAG TPA: dienelactone hydrolase [Cyanobacteria bacterium UBA11149]|nr:dienelactone hydrolase [Cyanobacteria bacterium UBA11367]HBK62876.1 dienelactone hydrolase [Cyanobacteria bacterium UBA11166]HBR76750.1 dienelactone hydrolase [Cyanobacteria bacterium UBA11159]HBS68534.1 dienelactone hydrolase [Cyanobacteria bacterium UBA11153]HBW87431.1 dienelactone hydrolase [Cyanobacteria bacterium UBA11149]HCA93509.1 dienelactone hydrolase [Cyanobacteria bacterium UBA9226]
MIKFNEYNFRGSSDRNPGTRVNLISQIGQIGWGSLFAAFVAMSCAIAAPAKAAERLTLRLGPFQQSVEIDDLEKFAQTGKLSPALKPYSALLTPEIQQLLNRRLQIDPKVTEKFVNDLLGSSDGIRVLDKIGLALPNSTVEDLKAALLLAARQANGFSVLSFLRAYPEENVVVDASAAIAIVLQINTPYLESIALAPLLEQEMTSTDDTPFPSSFDPAVGGSENVYERTIRLRDEERQRNILVDLYWADRTSGPLIILSHGFASDRKFLTYIARHLASYGFTVASVEHPGSNFSAINGGGIGTNFETVLPPTEFIDRPLDVSFVLNELADMNRGYGSLRDKLNTQQVTVIGHSLGGYTALALAGGKLDLAELRQFCKNRSPLRRAPADWFQCAATKLNDDNIQLEDRRVVQAMAFNPVTGRLFGKRGLAQVRIPTLILTGTADTITPSLNHQLRSFSQLGGSKYLIAAIGGTHLSVTDPGNLNDALAQSTLVQELTGKDAEPLRELLRGVTLAFVKQLTPDAKLYEPFLTPAYAQSLSTATLKLRMSTQLPSTIGTWLEVMKIGHQSIALRLPKINEWSIGGIRWPFSPST